MMAGEGLLTMPATSFSVTGEGAESATQEANGAISFTLCSSISLDGVFSASYLAYQLSLSVIATGSYDCEVRYRAAGVDDSTANYDRQALYEADPNADGARSTGQTVFYMGYLANDYVGMQTQIYNPMNASEYTLSRTIASSRSGGTAFLVYQTSVHRVASAFDGITIRPSPSAGRLISGRVQVFGYEE